MAAIFLAIMIFLADFFTKLWVQANAHNLPQVVIHNFLGIHVQVTHATNTGAAWGIFADFPHLLVAFRILLIGCLLVYLVAFNTRVNWKIPLVCIISGALGNVVDYFVYGSVIDMIQVNFWGYEYPVFNLADSSIFIGAFWLLTLSIFEKKSSVCNEPKKRPPS